MAEAEAEAAFLSSMQAMNENSGSYNVTGGGSEQQIDSSSSDEYDPAQDVQDITLLSGPQTSNPISSVDVSKNDVFSPVSAQPGSLRPGVNVVNPTSEYDRSSPTYSKDMMASFKKDHSSEALSAAPHGTNGAFRLKDENGAVSPQSPTSYDPLVQMAAQDLPVHAATQGNTASNDVTKSTNDIATSIATEPAPGEVSTRDDGIAKAPDAPPTLNLEQIRRSSVANQSPSPSSAAPKARLPHDKIGLLEDRIKEDERGDLDAWLTLIDEHKRRGKLDEARKVYERFFGIFPSAAEQWVAYIQMENDAQNRNAVDTIFNNTLMQIPNVQLWSAYLDHIRRHYNITTDTSGTARGVIYKAYELALQNIGNDKESGRIWQDYVQFVKSGPGNVGGSNWQDSQKMDSLRKAYHSAICVPTQSVESLWREFNQFEMGLNKVTGRKYLQDHSPAYMSARSSYTELQNITRDLKRTTLPTLPPALGFDGDVEYTKQVEIWKRWIQWEKDDPLVLKQDDLAAYKARVIFVYKQALMALRFWPEMWFEAAEFCFHNDLESEGIDFLNQGISANPESCLLAFKRADRIELSTSNEDGDEGVKRRGAAVREPYDKVLDALYELIAKTTAREARDLARIESQFLEATSNSVNGTKSEDNDRDAEDDETNRAEQRKKVQIDVVKNMNALQIRLIQKTLSHTWIALMRAIRRIQGKGKVGAPIGGSRQILTDARKRGRITSDVWVAAALLEFHMYEGEAAKRIFERGAKLYPEDEAFALEYIRHLIANNDHTNARVVFETTVGRLSQKPETLQKAKPLYAFFHAFESQHGELNQIMKLEKRMSDLFLEDPRLSSFSQRFTHEGFDPTAIRLIISPSSQARPRMMPTIETVSAQNSPPYQHVQPTNSPKRPLPFEEVDTEALRPRKFIRGESPLKGAAGRRLDQQKRSRLPNEIAQHEGQNNSYMLPPPALPREVLFLLSIIPKASTYHATRFKPEEMVKLIRETHIPSSVNQPRAQPPPVTNGVAMPHGVQMPPTQYNGEHRHLFSSSPEFSSPRRDPSGDTMRCREDRDGPSMTIRRRKRRSKRDSLYSPHKDPEILGLRHCHDDGPGKFPSPIPLSLQNVNLLSTVSPDDLNAWAARHEKEEGAAH